MIDTRNAQVGWSEAQWSHVRQAVTQEANKNSVARTFLPVYGPLPASTQVVPSERLDELSGSVDDVSTTRIVEVYVEFNLSQQQVAEDELASALLLFRRATNIVARLDDWIIFNGLVDARRRPGGILRAPGPGSWGYQIRPDGVIDTAHGLLDGTARINPIPLDSDGLVAGFARAVMELEGKGHVGPFVSVLGTDPFVAAYTPSDSGLVMPSDRIEPLIGSKFLRSSTIDDRGENDPTPRGVLISLAGDPVDLAVVAGASPQFLYVNQEARYVFRVYERFALRIKEQDAVLPLEFFKQPTT